MTATTLAPTMLRDRAVIRLSGEGVREFLQGLVTSDVAGALPVWAGLLTAQGKCLFDFFVWDEGDDLLLDCEAEAADDLVKRLAIYRLRRAITIERDDRLSVIWSVEGDLGSPDPRLPALGRRWLSRSHAKAGAQSGEAVLSTKATGLLPSQEHSWLEHRLRLGVCEGRTELGDILWLECNAAELNGVSFSKGCFVGQENTARMNWRSKINRRLLVVETTETGPRTRKVYPDLCLAVEHRRLDDLKGAIIPEWLQASIVA
jgi:folate-binding protein YgfZ